jgi:Lon protease-like protein
MSLNQSDHALPDGFANIVRLFPLPNLVLFPGVVQALHLFEPRYQALAEDSLAADELITMAYVKPDWKSQGDEPPTIADTVCVGKILSHTQLEDGRFNLFLVGTKRALIVSELPHDTPYRMAEVQIIEDTVSHLSDLKRLRQEIIQKFRSLAGLRTSWNHEALEQFLDDDLSFGQLVDMICYSCGASPSDQQLVLETSELGRRGEIVLELLQAQIEATKTEAVAKPDFPPGFSLN